MVASACGALFRQPHLLCSSQPLLELCHRAAFLCQLRGHSVHILLHLLAQRLLCLHRSRMAGLLEKSKTGFAGSRPTCSLANGLG